jgi:hypothetical protein
LLLLGLIALGSAASVANAAEAWKAIPLERVSVGVADINPGLDGRAAVVIPISNKSAGAVRVAVTLRPPAPAPECSAHMTLEAHVDTFVVCPQTGFVADADYLITVAAFADSAEGDTLESGSTSMRMSKKNVKELGQWLEASKLPQTFKHVEKVDRVTTGTTMGSMFGVPRGDGTLTVDASGVTYATKKVSLVIPASGLRGVKLNNGNPQQPWVVVTYEEGGESKSVSFKPNVQTGNGSVENMVAAIRASMSQQGLKR